MSSPSSLSLSSLSLFALPHTNALITGASRGIGAAAARALAQAGANVVLVYRRGSTDLSTYESIMADHDIMEEHRASARAAGEGDAGEQGEQGEGEVGVKGEEGKDEEGRGIPKAQVVYCDLDDMEDVKTLFPRALDLVAGVDAGGEYGEKRKREGEIHVLVNCAGIQRRAPSVEFSEGDWDEVLTVNLKSVWLLSQAAGQHMVPRRRGKIVNFCSLLTFQGGLTVPAYAAAKGALGQLTKALSNEWSAHNVQVNGVCPGYVGTDMNAALLADPVRLAQISARIPAGRWGTPEDFAGPVVFLASRASAYVCGELLVVDGGWMGR